jgi:hypothetical protein
MKAERRSVMGYRHSAGRLVVVATLVVGGLVLAGCQTVRNAPPKSDPSATLFVVPLELDNQTTRPFPVVFSLTFDNVEDWRSMALIDFSEDFGLVANLPAGAHTITAITVRWRPTNEILQKLTTSIPFSLTAGEGYILPLELRIVAQIGGSRLFYDQLTQQQLDEQRTLLLKDYTNMEAWFPVD